MPLLDRKGTGQPLLDGRTAELPMDEASRAARAADLGYTVDAYHGTRRSFDAFDPAEAGRSKRSDAPGGSYSFSSSPELASSYAQGKGGNVMPVKLRMENPAVYDAAGNHWGAIPTGEMLDLSAIGGGREVPRVLDTNTLAAQAREAGHDGLTVKNVGDWGSAKARKAGTTGDVHIVFDPANVRSRFAAFDPANEGSGMLLGSGSTDKRGAAATGMALLNGTEPTQPLLRGPIRAYHGSPHDFDRFDLSKIGTGEGAQAYGHGLYFAENEGVAKSYRDTLAPARAKLPDDMISMPPELRKALMIQVNSEHEPLAAAKWAQAMAPELRKDDPAKLADMIQRTRDAKNGRMYEVAIHADPERFLDWDKPLSGAAREFTGPPSSMFPENMTGAELYRFVSRGQEPQASASMREAGIPGIKYLDAGSRGGRVGLPAGPHQDVIRYWMEQAGSDPQKAISLMEAHGRAIGDPSAMLEPIKTLKDWQGPTSNYVVFDPAYVEILRKYGLAGLAALPPATLASMGLQAPEKAPQ